MIESELVNTVLRLREYLVRHDENLKAWRLLHSLVPYPIEDHPQIVAARNDQWIKVAHLFDADAYAAYYASNEEWPYERWNGMTDNDPLLAQDNYSRVLFAHNRLNATPAKTAIDCSAHDGWMALNLEHHFDGLVVDCVDMNPVNVAGARARALRGKVIEGDFRSVQGSYDVAFLFETVEHLRDPVEDLQTIGRFAKRLIVSTPTGSVEEGNLPNWAVAQPAGHVHAWSPDGFARMLAKAGEVVEMNLGSDGTMFAELSPAFSGLEVPS